MSALAALAHAVDAALPQTQCTRCGYADCAAYAQAIADESADINRCPPGGQEGVSRLAVLTHRPIKPLDPMNGIEGPRLLAVIDEAWCIGCTLCLDACPADAIVGGPKAMHTVIDAECTGCELCVPVCPVDCIALLPVTGSATGWNAWSAAQADHARARYLAHRERLARDLSERTERLAQTQTRELADEQDKRALIDAALARARAGRLKEHQPTKPG
jgi:electron transport complex protein RnfB